MAIWDDAIELWAHNNGHVHTLPYVVIKGVRWWRASHLCYVLDYNEPAYYRLMEQLLAEDHGMDLVCDVSIPALCAALGPDSFTWKSLTDKGLSLFLDRLDAVFGTDGVGDRIRKILEDNGIQLGSVYVSAISQELVDSGDRREFATGAVRDMAQGKGRCDLIPAGALQRMFQNRHKEFQDSWCAKTKESAQLAYAYLLQYLDGDRDVDHLALSADLLMYIMEFEDGGNAGEYKVYPRATLRLARHYEAGAKKYGAHNWTKGLPVSVFIDSGIRHLLKYLAEQKDEDHLVATAWNVLGAMWMEENKPELQDIPTRTRGE